ncbi:hypothetical protein COW09_01515 [bacterium (Candidatus Moisslbacteria) CG12_big_fil_rev_8_21_14_0_65_36_11]|nr:hypothetical protein [Candidatus Kuenenbacteria bacterium]OIP76783.1 MAG: hypothetical protein AUK09_01030 [Parcubacteria group bacterium CG2_30_36_38]PIV46173.1 MAG: hypothetical protein COS23_00515 [bacterium (Candidatus Moisslbacteria) CG02_land_8_20_14_3_00_36_53]PIW67815.1 MAG: hypothetical protein COW09_01515 [bacterium (Candidatus Moisslbacteria) CG12_big_fil_rev_8_21_14_0_65_36_11]PIZ90385.1 MAG: hypothetical protein COX87_00760 [bacterium (Candidatus Moisslbacteria) CG_4_10_14_0_2_u
MAINRIIYVRKTDGREERFEARKVFRTCLRAGAKKEEAKKIVSEVIRRIYDGIPTREILKMVLKKLEGISPSIANIYNLKEAMISLGPSGFVFEEFMTQLLLDYDFKTKHHIFISGHCVKHEIDIIADERSGKKRVFMIECKYHNISGIYCGIKEALYTWARFEDCQNFFDAAWLITNTKFSEEVIRYAQCKNMRLLGWRHGEEACLENLIEEQKFYPITILRNLDESTRDKLFEKNIILCKDLIKYDFYSLSRLCGIKKDKAENLIKQANDILI